MPKVPRRAIEEAKIRLVESGFLGDTRLERVARVALSEPMRVLESFGCKVVFPRKIKRRPGYINVTGRVIEGGKQ